MNVETDVISSIGTSLIGRAVIHTTMYVEAFKTYFFPIKNVIMYLTSYLYIICSDHDAAEKLLTWHQQYLFTTYFLKDDQIAKKKLFTFSAHLLKIYYYHHYFLIFKKKPNTMHIPGTVNRHVVSQNHIFMPESRTRFP